MNLICFTAAARLQYAMELLSSREGPVAGIADICGIEAGYAIPATLFQAWQLASVAFGRSVHAHSRCAIFVLVTSTFWRLLSPTCSCRTVLVDLGSVAWLCLRLRARFAARDLLASPFGNVVNLQRREQSSAGISARSFVKLYLAIL